MPPRVHNLLANLPDARSEEVVQSLLTFPGGRLERIVSRGQASPEGFWYDQEQAEWVMVVSGQARLAIEADGNNDKIEHALGPGDSLFLPAHCRHRVSWTDPGQDTVWLALFVDGKGKDLADSGNA